MRKPAVALLTLLSVASVAHAQATTQPSLARRGPELKFDQIALAEAMDFFRDAIGTNLVVDWKALEEIGMGRETPVSLRLRGVAIGVALRKTLDAAGGPGLIAFYIDGNVIHVTSKLVADARMVTRVYAVADLLTEIPDFTDAPTLGLPSANGGGRRGGSGGGSSSSSGSLLGNTGGTGQATRDRKTLPERAQGLVDLIQETIRPEVWDVNGGKAAIRYSAGRLIVTAPPAVQALIGGR